MSSRSLGSKAESRKEGLLGGPGAVEEKDGDIRVGDGR